MHTDSQVKSPQWLYHLQFSGFNAFWSAPERSVSWLTWMSLPNKLKCSHTVITLRCEGNLLCMNHQFVYVPCGVVRWVRKEKWYTTVSHVQIYIFFSPFKPFAQNGRWQCFQNGWMLPLCLLELLSLFYQLKGKLKWSWCLLVIKIKDDEMGYNFCLLLLFFNHHSYCITGADKVLVLHTLSRAAAKSWALVSSGGEKIII